MSPIRWQRHVREGSEICEELIATDRLLGASDDHEDEDLIDPERLTYFQVVDINIIDIIMLILSTSFRLTHFGLTRIIDLVGILTCLVDSGVESDGTDPVWLPATFQKNARRVTSSLS